MARRPLQFIYEPSDDLSTSRSDSLSHFCQIRYVVSTHAAEELDDDQLTIIDLETIVLNGQITERQHDAKTRETKLVVRGKTLDGSVAETIVKVGHTGQLVVITAYRADDEH